MAQAWLETRAHQGLSCRRAGTDVGDILHASQALAHAQSERQATACRLLPPVHWALLYTIGALFVSTFILFETGGSFSNEGRHILFTVLCGLMSFVLVVRRQNTFYPFPTLDKAIINSVLAIIVYLVYLFTPSLENCAPFLTLDKAVIILCLL